MNAELKGRLGAALGKKLAGLILFGSYARGDYSRGSDLDFLLLLASPATQEEKQKISRICSSLSLSYDTVIVCIDYLQKEFDKRSSPLVLNVKKEGVRI